MSIHTAILCEKCKLIIGTRHSDYTGKVTIEKDAQHKCDENLPLNFNHNSSKGANELDRR